MSEIDTDQIEEQGKVSDIPDSLRLISGSYEVNQFLNNLGIKHNPESIVLEDSYNCVFYGTHNDEFQIWVCHKSTPYLNARTYKIDLYTCNQYYLSELLA